jgi:hypothetical protein
MPTEDGLVEVAGGSRTRSTLSRRTPLIQVSGNDIADSGRFARGTGSVRIVPFKDTRWVIAAPPHGAVEAPSCDCRSRASASRRRRRGSIWNCILVSKRCRILAVVGFVMLGLGVTIHSRILTRPGGGVIWSRYFWT